MAREPRPLSSRSAQCTSAFALLGKFARRLVDVRRMWDRRGKLTCQRRDATLRGGSVDGLDNLMQVTCDAPEGERAKLAGQRGSNQRWVYLAGEALRQRLALPETGGILRQRLGDQVGPVIARRSRAIGREPGIGGWWRGAAEDRQGLVGLHAPQGEEQKWIAVEFLADQGVDGSEVITGV